MPLLGRMLSAEAEVGVPSFGETLWTLRSTREFGGTGGRASLALPCVSADVWQRPIATRGFGGLQPSEYETPVRPPEGQGVNATGLDASRELQLLNAVSPPEDPGLIHSTGARVAGLLFLSCGTLAAGGACVHAIAERRRRRRSAQKPAGEAGSASDESGSDGSDDDEDASGTGASGTGGTGSSRTRR